MKLRKLQKNITASFSEKLLSFNFPYFPQNLGSIPGPGTDNG